MGPAQGLECFIKAADTLKKNKEIIFLMMGDGILRSYFVDKIKTLSLKILFYYHINLFTNDPSLFIIECVSSPTSIKH